MANQEFNNNKKENNVSSLQTLCARNIKNNWCKFQNQIDKNEFIYQIITRLWEKDINNRKNKINNIYKLIFENLFEPKIADDTTVKFMEFMYPSIHLF